METMPFPSSSSSSSSCSYSTSTLSSSSFTTQTFIASLISHFPSYAFFFSLRSLNSFYSLYVNRSGSGKGRETIIVKINY